MGELLCNFLCPSLSVSPFWPDFRPIPALYADIPAFYKYFPLCLPPYVVLCAVCELGGGGGRMGGENLFTNSREELF